jgi:Tol biopolymer transport system component
MRASRIFYRYNAVDSHYGHVAYVDGKHPADPTFIDKFSCETIYVAADSGICLKAKRGVVTTYTGVLFDANTLETRAQLPLPGVPSRNRISRDGKVAAYTVFVTGHGYTALDFSTQTLILDAHTGQIIGDLEAFAVTRDDKPFKESDFNFWGVTFTPDGKNFYATLSSGGAHYLVRGDIDKRTATVIHTNVECPSLSPDGKRVAYKKRFIIDQRIVWELHVLDLATGKETPLADKRSIDDQLEWLDTDNVLYSVPATENDTNASTSVWIAAADGKTKPRLFLPNAYSPSAVR